MWGCGWRRFVWNALPWTILWCIQVTLMSTGKENNAFYISKGLCLQKHKIQQNVFNITCAVIDSLSMWNAALKLQSTDKEATKCLKGTLHIKRWKLSVPLYVLLQVTMATACLVMETGAFGQCQGLYLCAYILFHVVTSILLSLTETPFALLHISLLSLSLSVSPTQIFSIFPLHMSLSISLNAKG